MIDPINMTRYDQSDVELEETLLFSCCVAGKNAVTTARALDQFLQRGHRLMYLAWRPGDPYTPFDMLNRLFRQCGGTSGPMVKERVASMLRLCGIGCFNHRAETFWQLACAYPDLDLKICTPEDLEQVWGIAEKTSRFFILHTRENARFAALDTHIRKHMVALGIQFPKGQPKGKRYREIEGQFLQLADRSGMTVAEYDLAIWNRYAGHKAS